ncbi:MAG: hypothetical protein KDA60_02510 [Planctomycetales bacterium]|nr:hypothetical protein [Planctomycetales bacterium]
MQRFETTWEDEETNRRVDLVVNYSRNEAGVAINELTPTKVTFLDPATNNEVRSVGVWTQTGRRVLARQFRATPHFEAVHATINEQILASSM